MDPYTRICFNSEGFNPEDLETETSEDQLYTEEAVMEAYNRWISIHGDVDLKATVWKEDHVFWLMRSLSNLSAGHSGLYASQSWLCFWIIHSLDLLGATSAIPPTIARAAVQYILSMQCEAGGFGGGPYQEPHILATYAAVMALLTLGARCGLMVEVMAGINKQTLLAFYERMKVREGSNKGGFHVQDDGEVDTRAVYCMAAVCVMLQIDISALTADTGDFLARCQTHEGGIGAEPYNEAHGGYAFCGLAAAVLLRCPHKLDLDALLRWMSARQFAKEGGFSGRANKLVDACYNYWVGAMFPVWNAARAMTLHMHGTRLAAARAEAAAAGEVTCAALRSPLQMARGICTAPVVAADRHLSVLACVAPPARMGWLFDQRALQLYTVLVGQSASPSYGVRDKPGKQPDLYHTCYGLSGLSCAQSSCAPPLARQAIVPADNGENGAVLGGESANAEDEEEDVVEIFNVDKFQELNPNMLGGKTNKLVTNNALFNVSEAVLSQVMQYFREQQQPHGEQTQEAQK